MGGIMNTQNYREMADMELINTYNAVMANAYPGDEFALEEEMESRGLTEDMFEYPCPT